MVLYFVHSLLQRKLFVKESLWGKNGSQHITIYHYHFLNTHRLAVTKAQNIRRLKHLKCLSIVCKSSYSIHNIWFNIFKIFPSSLVVLHICIYASIHFPLHLAYLHIQQIEWRAEAKSNTLQTFTCRMTEAPRARWKTERTPQTHIRLNQK